MHRVELGTASVTVKKESKRVLDTGAGFPDCRYFMPSKEGHVWVINDA